MQQKWLDSRPRINLYVHERVSMSAIEPGEIFRIEYGSGHTIDVVALGLRGKRAVHAILQKIGAGLQDRMQLIDLCEEGLRLCVAKWSDEYLDRIDESQALEIIGKTLAAAVIDEGTRKKSELPHCSDAASCASPAAQSANEINETTTQRLSASNVTGTGAVNAMRDNGNSSIVLASTLGI